MSIYMYTLQQETLPILREDVSRVKEFLDAVRGAADVDKFVMDTMIYL